MKSEKSQCSDLNEDPKIPVTMSSKNKKWSMKKYGPLIDKYFNIKNLAPFKIKIYYDTTLGNVTAILNTIYKFQSSSMVK